MRKGTSGLMFTQNGDGGITLEVVDYGVEQFGGGEWESRYDLDSENAALLKSELEKTHTGTFAEMCKAEFGEGFNTLEFEGYCKERSIKYSHSSWF